MMENYEDIRLGHVNTKDVCSVRNVSFERDEDFPEFGNQTNLNFGAEILSTLPSPSLSPTDDAAQTLSLLPIAAAAAALTEATSEKHNKTNIETKTKILLAIDEQQQQQQQQQKQTESEVENINVNINCARQDCNINNEENSETEPNEVENLEERYCSIRTVSQSSANEQPDTTDPTDESTTDTDCSEVSGLSEITDSVWKPNRFHLRWIQRQMHSGRDPRDLLSIVLPNGSPPAELAPGSNDMMLWHMLSNMLSSCGENEPRRQKLRNINTFEDVIELVRNSKKIIVLTGAGVSVSCGIPDFRSSNGIYSRLARDFPDLPDPQAMFDINYFSRDPRPFFKFAREIYPGQFEPSPGHRFIKMLETKGKLLRNYTQNIDTLEQVAGIRNVIECHGSFSTASCTKCKFKCSADDIRSDIFTQRIPVCPKCQPKKHHSVAADGTVTEIELKQLVEKGIMKPDIVFFGEGLPDEFHNVMATDKEECDLLIVMGSSLKVRPVNYIPNSIPGTVPQILINREKLHHLEFDVELLGDSDVIINQLCHHLGEDWKEICFDNAVLTESTELLPVEDEPLLLQDIDTQSLKSSGSTDYMMGSAGTCSDSGFESSTFSNVNVRRNSITNMDATQAIEKIKSDILVELNETNPTDNVNDDILEILDEAQVGEILNCEQFAAPSSATENYRHLSIDSSKDSGIEPFGEASNPTPPILAQLPPYDNFTNNDNIIFNTPSTSVSHASNENRAVTDVVNDIADIKNNAQPPYKLQDPQVPPQKRRSAAERLTPGTFYCIGNNRSYVFPGAQVFLENDFDYTEVVSEEDEEHNDIFDDEDTNDVDDRLSTLLQSPIGTQLVNDMNTYATTLPTTTTKVTTQSPNKKRRNSLKEEVCTTFSDTVPANDENIAAAEHLAATSACQTSSQECDCMQHASTSNSAKSTAADINATNINTSISSFVCNPPPTKKSRSSFEYNNAEEDQLNANGT